MSDTSRAIVVDRDRVLDEVRARIVPANVVLDIGCGIRPQTWVSPRVHVCCEPWAEYATWLATDPQAALGRVVVHATGQAFTRLLPDASVDSVFLLDVIEHLEREDGVALLRQCERIARRQIVVYTPLGFLRQEYEEGDTDAWGLHGGAWQRHRSGWLPADFGAGWTVFACPDYHRTNGKGELLDPPHGALWAIRDMAARDETAMTACVVAERVGDPGATRTSEWLRESGVPQVLVWHAGDDPFDSSVPAVCAGWRGYNLNARPIGMSRFDDEDPAFVDGLELQHIETLLRLHPVTSWEVAQVTAGLAVNAHSLSSVGRPLRARVCAGDGEAGRALLDQVAVAADRLETYAANVGLLGARMHEIHARASTIANVVRREGSRTIVPLVESDPLDLAAAVLAGRWTGVPVRPVLLCDYPCTWPASRRAFAERLARLLLSCVDPVVDSSPRPADHASDSGTPRTADLRLP
jgi:hypothetical protein